jgi:hypothetical protein
MFDDSQVRLVIILIVAVFLALAPFSAYRFLKREGKLFGTALKNARNPWQDEDKDLEELGRRVEALTKKDQP